MFHKSAAKTLFSVSGALLREDDQMTAIIMDPENSSVPIIVTKDPGSNRRKREVQVDELGGKLNPGCKYGEICFAFLGKSIYQGC